MDLKILSLDQCPHYLGEIAQYSASEFGLTEEFYRSSLKEAKTFVALLNNSLVGFVCIDKEDLIHEKYKEIHNWLADLYVLEPFRRQGIADFLVDHVIQESKDQPLFLWTEHHYLLPFFIKKGFIIEDLLKMDKHSTFVMVKNPNVSLS